MTIEEIKHKYFAILGSRKRPLLISNDDTYAIHPESIRDLKFEKDGVHFIATFNKEVRRVAVYIEDILDVIEEHPNL